MVSKALSQRILRSINRANRDFTLLAKGDRILVAMSGGKDSHVMLWALEQIQRAAVFPFELVAYHLDQGQPGYDGQVMQDFMQTLSIPWEIEHQDTYTRVVEKTEPGKVYCSLCSRFRRAILYKAANRHGCNKVALGHHREDLIETLLLNLFFSGQIKSMPPLLVSDNGQQQVIRPLCYTHEPDLAELAKELEFPIIPCNLCGTQKTQRQFIKNLLHDLEANNMHLKGNLLAALGNVVPSHLLDRNVNPVLANRDISEQDGESTETPQALSTQPASTTNRLNILSPTLH